MREREQTAASELATRALETGLRDVANAFSTFATALTSTAGDALLAGSKLSALLAAHLIGTAATMEKAILLHGAELVAGDEHAGQRLLCALRGFEISIAETATRPTCGKA